MTWKLLTDSWWWLGYLFSRSRKAEICHFLVAESSHVFPSWLSDPYKHRGLSINPIKCPKQQPAHCLPFHPRQFIISYKNRPSDTFHQFEFVFFSFLLRLRVSFKEIIITIRSFLPFTARQNNNWTFPCVFFFLFFFASSCNITKTFLILLLLCTRVASPASCNSIGGEVSETSCRVFFFNIKIIL